MKTTNNKALLATLSFLFPYTAAMADVNADTSPHFSIGLKAWDATWSTALPTFYNVVTPSGTFRLSESLDQTEAKRKTSFIPSIAVKKGDFLLSASFARVSGDFLAPNTSVVAPNGMNVATWRSDHIKRKENDLTAGYYAMQNIVLSVAYKHASEERSTTIGLGGGPVPLLDNRAHAVLLGAALNFPITDKLSLSNQIAYGPARVRIMLADKSVPDTSYNSRYMIYEIGLNYVLPAAVGNGVVLGAGYRSQQVRTSGNGPAQMNSRRFRDEREGFLLSMTLAF